MYCKEKHSKCSDNGSAHQPFPDKGPLASESQRNLSLAKLGRIANGDVVYLYVMTSIEYQDQKFLQYGTGPNFQGDLITLCTCKHRMRSSMDASEWRGKWIAGFTGITEHQKRNFLVYLMQVSRAFESFRDFWENNISEETKNAKAAHVHKFGDIYKPKHDGIRPYEVEDYEQPCKDHDHRGCWREDIDYQNGYSGRPAALLVGDQRNSLLWDERKIWYSQQLRRNCQKLQFKDFLNKLEQI